MTILIHLHGLCESGKANLAVSNVEYCVVAIHKGLPQDPVWHVFNLHNDTKASLRAKILCNEVEFRQGEFPASDGEGNRRDRGVARINPESTAIIESTRNVRIESSNIGGITNY
jgi:hypothetical protein